jgi:hypothetical protein
VRSALEWQSILELAETDVMAAWLERIDVVRWAEFSNINILGQSKIFSIFAIYPKLIVERGVTHVPVLHKTWSREQMVSQREKP